MCLVVVAFFITSNCILSYNKHIFTWALLHAISALQEDLYRHQKSTKEIDVILALAHHPEDAITVLVLHLILALAHHQDGDDLAHHHHLADVKTTTETIVDSTIMREEARNSNGEDLRIM